MRKLVAFGCLILGVAGSSPSLGDVAPLTPEGRIMMAKRDWLENAVRARVGHELVERARDWRQAYGAILVADERANARPRLLIKDEYGWIEMGPGRTQRLPVAIGHELNRLLLEEPLWRERPFSAERPCRGSARIFLLRHAGQEQFGREPCGTKGLAGRAAAVAATLRIPAGKGQTIAPPSTELAPSRVPQAQHDLTRHIFHRMGDMAASWERKILAALVDVYAEDVIVERPEGVLRGRKAVVDWAKYQQDWASPGMSRPMTLHIVNMPNVQGNCFYSTHELRWEEEGQPRRQTFSTLWRNNGGLWQIAYERVSAVKPVAGRPPPWVPISSFSCTAPNLAEAPSKKRP
jgi:ketosteroid isomerase-like protein